MNPEVAYLIDKEESFKSDALVIRLVEARREGVSLILSSSPSSVNQARWKQLATEKDKDALRILTLKECIIENNALTIPYAQTVQALKLLAASGKVYFNKKQLACDFYSKIEFYYLVDETSVSGMLKSSSQEFALTDSDFVCSGSSISFIKGHSLKLIQSNVSWKDIKLLYLTPAKFSTDRLIEDPDDEDAPKIVYKGHSQEKIRQEQGPLPLLILKDRSGAFADLWMNYSNNQLLAYHDPVMQKNRDLAAEKNWENDLLETDFQKKQVGQTHYFCPLDQVRKSITFLLEIGWNVQDWQHKKVLLMDSLNYDMKMQGDTIHLSGKLKYKDYEADLKDVAGAFNRRDQFVHMGQDAVGLLPDLWNGTELNSLFEDSEIVSDGLVYRKNQIGSLDKLLQSPQNAVFDKALSQLKDGFFDLSKTPQTQPDPSFLAHLRPYQQEGLNWLHFLHTYGFNGILADDMGLGKTVQVLAFISQLCTKLPILIVMPTSLIFNWQREIEKFLPEKTVLLHHGPSRSKSASTFKQPSIVLTSYATMRLDSPMLQEVSFAAIILDEAQAIKNASSLAAKAALFLNAPFKLLLTGTPLENHIREIWSHFNFLMPDLLGDEKSFQADLKASSSDLRYLQKIKRKIKPFILRRKKSDVAKDLPECIEQIVWVEMSPQQRQVYDSFLAGIKQNLFTKVTSEGLKKNKLEIFEAILRLRQICCHPLLISSLLPAETSFESSKLDALMQDLENALEENDKVLVYSQFTSMLHLIAKEVQARGWKFVSLDGSTTNREKVVDQFQNDPDTHLFLISLKAGGTGLNLTAADHVLIFDPWWNEAAENQAINRAHRIGRQSTVFAKRYVTVESIEEKMMKLKEKKRLLVESIFDDDQAFSQLTMEDLEYLLSS